MMLDAHQHFWALARGDYDWLGPELTALYHDFSPEDLWPQMQAAGISRTIAVQAAATEAESDYLLSLAAQHDFIAGVVGWLDILAPDFPQRLAHYRAQPKWLGLRPMLQDHDPSLIADPRFGIALAEVARQGAAFDLLIFPHHFPAFLAVLETIPDLRVILDHIGKPDMSKPRDPEWEAGITRLAAYPGAWCKISGLVTEAGQGWTPAQIRPFVTFAAKAFGPERLVFGSDWPVCTLAASHAQVVDLARDLLSEIFSQSEVSAIFETNAATFYRI